jgi:uncharacterized protein
MLIDAEQLINYQRCRRRTFLDTYGDLRQRDATSEYLLKLLQDSQANRQFILSSQKSIRPDYSSGDLQAAADATLRLMQQGAERIHQGILLSPEVNGVTLNGLTLKSNPDLLVKHPGQSDFGDWLYVPIEIKLGKRPKLEYQVAAAFHTMVLAQVQGAWPETAWLRLKERGAYSVDLWEVLPRMQQILDECIQMLLQEQEPEVFIARSRCSLCHWLSHCHAIAKADQHLSLLPGVTPTRYVQLQAINLLTVKSLAETNPVELEPLPGFGRDAAYKLVRQARSALHNRAFLIEENFTSLPEKTGSRLPNRAGQSVSRPTHPAHLSSNSLSGNLISGGSISSNPISSNPGLSVPTAPIELYFDIEAEPTMNVAYLHGVLVVDRQADTHIFHPLLAEHPQDEALVWQQFLELVSGYPTAPIFHFCPYEFQTVERLAKLYGTPSHRIQPLLNRFVDLHDRVTRLVTLPVESYALKPIARWLGFEWRDPAANGAQSICWYSQWLSTGDRTHIDAILTYNEDDCRATHHVKDWLVGFLMESLSTPTAEFA